VGALGMNVVPRLAAAIAELGDLAGDVLDLAATVRIGHVAADLLELRLDLEREVLVAAGILPSVSGS
jgi:hypothetical protein